MYFFWCSLPADDALFATSLCKSFLFGFHTYLKLNSGYQLTSTVFSMSASAVGCYALSIFKIL